MEAVSTIRMGKESEAEMNLLIDETAENNFEEIISISLPLICPTCGLPIEDRPYRWMVFDCAAEDYFVHVGCANETILFVVGQSGIGPIN